MRANTDCRGYSLLEVLTVCAVLSVFAATAIPAAQSQMRLWALNSSIQAVGAEIRSARFTAVSKNRVMRVRFNCPAVNQYRIVEVVGTAAIDNAANRCDLTAYPFPDPDPSVAPNLDGPVMTLSQDATFGAIQNLQISTTGRVSPLTGCPTCTTAAPPATLVLGNGFGTKTITVTTGGQVLLP